MTEPTHRKRCIVQPVTDNTRPRFGVVFLMEVNMEETKELLQRILDTLERIEEKLEPKKADVSLMLDGKTLYETVKKTSH